jgi:hypothetical protein
MSAFTMEKMAVFAPMESAKVRITVAVKPGLRRNCRTANLKFCSSVPIEAQPFKCTVRIRWTKLRTEAGSCVSRTMVLCSPQLHPGCQVQRSVNPMNRGVSIAEDSLRLCVRCPLPDIGVRERTGIHIPAGFLAVIRWHDGGCSGTDSAEEMNSTGTLDATVAC